MTDNDVEPLAIHHLRAAAQLYVEVFNTAPWNDAWTIESAYKRLSDTLATPGAYGLIVQPREPVAVLIGYMEQWYDGAHFYLKELYVHPMRQRSGIGTRLMQLLEAHLHDQGVDRIYLLTEREGTAADFYRRLGFYHSPRMALMARRLDL